LALAFALGNMVTIKQIMKTIRDLRERRDLVEKTILSMERLQQVEFGDILASHKPAGQPESSDMIPAGLLAPQAEIRQRLHELFSR
jgi:hypothetical protein